MTKELKQYIALILDNQRLMMRCLKKTDFDNLIDEELIEQTSSAVIELTKDDKPKKQYKAKRCEVSVFEVWNGIKSWQNHRKINEHLSSIQSSFKAGYTYDDIYSAINNYVRVVESEEHYFNHKWALKDFLKRGLLNFLNSADPLNNYRIKDGRKAIAKPVVSNEEKDEFGSMFI